MNTQLRITGRGSRLLALLPLLAALTGCAALHDALHDPIPAGIRGELWKAQTDTRSCYTNACAMCDILCEHGDTYLVLAIGTYSRWHAFVEFHYKYKGHEKGILLDTTRYPVVAAAVGKIKWRFKGYRPTQKELREIQEKWS